MTNTAPRPRTILRLSGPDTDEFLQGLVTNDLNHLTDGLLYAAMLSPQGKYIADFILLRDGDDVLLDTDAELASPLITRLKMYKLRAAVQIEETSLHLHRGLGLAPKGTFGDPRTPELGWRAYRDTPQTDGTNVDWDAVRIENLVPEFGSELGPDSYILEMGFERLKGVDFKKGCYVGQEVTARMKHKTVLRKGLAAVQCDGSAPVGTPITKDSRAVGTLFTQSNGRALAYLRFDKANGDLSAGEASVHRVPD